MEHLISTWGYLAIFLLSIAQSACIPTSSELTFGFAGFLAASGHLNLVGIVGAGVSGEVIGAYIAWAFGRTGGRALITHYGRYVHLRIEELNRVEAWYARHPRWGVLVGRLIPIIRNFVALSAGLAEVPPIRFGILTAIGSLIWDAGLTVVGFELGTQWPTVMHAISDAGYLFVALIAVVMIGAVWLHRRQGKTVERIDQSRDYLIALGRVQPPTVHVNPTGVSQG
ncbi:MAG: DedA family protein [Ferrimicrobium sp.]